ncbi:MAG: 3,4-dehydroadipyl-CoA semialdehyde dehydrogenase [Deltaproteobacteria bacterium]|nr:3,4-dehydroadipyl-CoA semialdehyde dehydrogenase [Deltaproteobacteria bacterium]
MENLRSYLGGRWIDGSGDRVDLFNPATEEVVAGLLPDGLDYAAALAYGRAKGGPALRAMTFAQRGAMLKSLAGALHAKRDELLDIGMLNGGNTRSDAKFDVDGAIGTLTWYAELGASLGDGRWILDGQPVSLGRSSKVTAQHVLTPRLGVAVHVNAFNFPAWGLAEKAAVALLAGVPVLARPAPATAWLAARVVELFLASGALPDGALSLSVGAPGDLLDHLGPQDVFAFTGSGKTGAMLRGRPNLLASGTHVNVEADSLNGAVLGPDVERGGDTWTLMVSDLVRDITQKAGQKCTAIRRVLVPRDRLDELQEDVIERLLVVRTGDPRVEGVTMGPVATAAQLEHVREGLGRLIASGAKAVAGGPARIDGEGVAASKGYFVAPTLLRVDDAASGDAVHSLEVFGPSATLIPYEGASEAVALLARGGGGLVTSVYSEDRAFAAEVVMGTAPSHGRVTAVNAKVAGAWIGPGAVLPQLIHGGPGHAGGGEELGGARGMGLYLQRTAIQGYGPLVEYITSSGVRAG